MVAFLVAASKHLPLISQIASPTDINSLLDRLAEKPLDPDTYQRVRARQEAITADLRKQHGEMDLAVAIIREIREER